MSRFGIRDKLRRFARRGSGAEPDPRYAVRLVLPDGSEHRVEAEHRYTVVMASQTLATPIDTGCPDGTCGGCVVDVLEGGAGLSAAVDAEDRAYRDRHGRDRPVTERLACHARIEGDGLCIRVREVWTMASVTDD